MDAKNFENYIDENGCNSIPFVLQSPVTEKIINKLLIYMRC